VSSISWVPPGLGYKILDMLIGVAKGSVWIMFLAP